MGTFLVFCQIHHGKNSERCTRIVWSDDKRQLCFYKKNKCRLGLATGGRTCFSTVGTIWKNARSPDPGAAQQSDAEKTEKKKKIINKLKPVGGYDDCGRSVNAFPRSVLDRRVPSSRIVNNNFLFPLPVAHLPTVYPLLSLSPISTRYYTHACSMIYIIIVQSERGDSVPWSTNDDWPVFDVAEHREQSETFGKPKRVRWIGENSGVAGKGAGKKLCGFFKKSFDRSKPMKSKSIWNWK